MVLNILLCIFVLIVVAIFIVLVSPFSFLLHYQHTSAFKTAFIKTHWLHPRVISCNFDFKNKSPIVLIFNRFKIQLGESDYTEESEGPFSQTEVPAASKNTEKLVDKPKAVPTKPASKEEFKSKTQALPPKEKIKSPGLFARIRAIFEKLQNGLLPMVMFFLRQTKLRNKIFRWLLKSVSSFFHVVTLEATRIHVRAGFEDPAETGKYFGYWQGFSHALLTYNNKKYDLNFEPVFTAPCFELDVDVCIKSSLLQCIKPVVGMVVTFPYLTACMVWLSFWRMNKKRKQGNK